MFRIWPFHKKVDSDFYQHTFAPLFSNGAEHAGFVRKFADPPILLTGVGYIPQGNINALQTPQVYATLAVAPTGVGVQAGSPNFSNPLYQYDSDGNLTPAG